MSLLPTKYFQQVDNLVKKCENNYIIDILMRLLLNKSVPPESFSVHLMG